MKAQPKVKSIGVSEFRARRDRVLAELTKAKAVGVVFAGEGRPDDFRVDQNFAYLTGIRDEPGACVVFDWTNPDPKRRCMLFLRPLNPEAEAWDGYREALSETLRGKHGFDSAFRTTHLSRFVTQGVKMSKRVALLHPFAGLDASVGPDLAMFRKAMERIPGVAIEDQTELLPQMRAVKSKAELEVMEEAVAITARGYDAALGVIRPGVRECDIQRAMERCWQDHGAKGVAYESIVGTGINSTILHYRAGEAIVQDGDIICIDAGCSYLGYASDITRGYPASGVFSKRQREIYNLVLRAQKAAIKAVKPGAWWHDVDEAAMEVFRKAGMLDRYLHGIGHQLGLEVHDANPTRPLEAGMVITIEPGLYLPTEKIGVRIEDDVLVTRTGSRNLSPMIAKEADEVEELMKKARSR
jgi:Xaa-Pro aminopeptidase